MRRFLFYKMSSQNGEMKQEVIEIDDTPVQSPPQIDDANFSVDHSKIPHASVTLPNNIIEEAFDQSVFETNVLAQVEAAAEKEQRETVESKKKLVAEIDKKIKTTEGKQLEELLKKRKRLVDSIAALTSVAAVSSVLLEGPSDDVRTGKATPFGTKVVVKEEATSFDNFLAGIGTKRIQSLAKVKKQRAMKMETSSEKSAEPSPVTLHADMQSVDRLLKHKQEDVEEFERSETPSPLKRPKVKSSSSEFVDDADLNKYSRRLKRWEKEDALFNSKSNSSSHEAGSENEGSNEIITFDDKLKVPARLWRQLYSYQRVGVRWLWELHQQQTGGILADEMGLGKTVEISAFLFAVRLSRQPDAGSAVINSRRYVGLGPVLVVCPVTLLRQWASELHLWAPVFRAVILHNTTGTTSEPLADLLEEVIGNSKQAPPIVITSYATLLLLGELITSIDWHYVILDEGHKIRNPDAKVTILCKQFRTSHRIVVSGSPIQNNLKELWCLFDFVYPGKVS